MSRYLFANKKPIPIKKIASICSYSLDDLTSLLQEYASNQTIACKHINEINQLLETSIIAGDDFLKDMEVFSSIFDVNDRVPVISIMGHVDHGKTSLLQKLKQIDKIEEVGGITQNIRAFEWNVNGQKTFLIDSPGHAIFSKQRQFVAEISDLIIVVIAADRGIEDQTIDILKYTEGKNHIICITKIDKPGKKNFKEIYSKLSKYKINVLSGEVPSAEISVNDGFENTIEKLKETICVTAQNLGLKTENDRPGIGYILDSWNTNEGTLCNIYLKAGNLSVGDSIINDGNIYKIKSIKVENQSVKTADCTQILTVSGVSALSGKITVIPNDMLDYVKKNVHLLKTYNVSESINKEMENFICKANSSLQLTSLCDMVKEYGNVLFSDISNISANDVKMAKEFKCVILIFGKMNCRALEEQEIPYIQSEVIYDIADKLKDRNKKEVIEIEELGTAFVKATFNMKDYIVGCNVKSGVFAVGDKCKIISKATDEIIYDGEIKSMQIQKKEVDKASKGNDCGLLLKNCNGGVNVQDIVICYKENKIIK